VTDRQTDGRTNDNHKNGRELPTRGLIPRLHD